MRMLLVGLFSWLLVSVCAADVIDVEDLMGRRVAVPVPVERAILGQHFEDFIAVGGAEAAQRLVAIPRRAWEAWQPGSWAAYSQALPELEALADIGLIEAGSFSVERVIALNPDVVILSAAQYRAVGDRLRPLELAGIPWVVIDYHSQTVARHVASTQLLGVLLGRESRAEAIGEAYRSSMRLVERRLRAADRPRPSVYIEWGGHGPDQYGNSYGEVMWGPIVGRAGGRNIAAGRVRNWGPLEPEYVVAEDPDHIVLAGSEWHDRTDAVMLGFGIDAANAERTLTAFTRRDGWSELSAITGDRLHAVYHPAARSMRDQFFVQFLAQTLYPDLFPDLTPVRDLAGFHERWLPVSADGVFMHHAGSAD